MMNCHYISTQLARIQQAKIGAAERLSIGGSSGLEEQLQAIELAILRGSETRCRGEKARRKERVHNDGEEHDSRKESRPGEPGRRRTGLLGP